MAAIELTINGKARSVDADPNTPLLWVLRDSLHLTAQVDGRLEERWDADRSALRLCCGSVARRRGGLWLRLPAAWRLADPARGLEPWSGGVRIPIESPSPWSLALAFCPAE